jgi:hypothetical protein
MILLKLWRHLPPLSSRRQRRGRRQSHKHRTRRLRRQDGKPFFSMYTRKFIYTSVYMYCTCMLCNENSIYVILFWELHTMRSLSPYYNIHVSVSELPYSQDGSTYFLQQIRQIVRIYKSLTDTWMWKLGLWPSNSFSGNICVEFCVCILRSVSKYSRWRKNRWRHL